MGAGPSLTEAGCFQECTSDPNACGEGETCQTVQYNPCPCPPDAEACCGACGAETQMCMPGEFDAVCGSIIGKTFFSIEEYDCGLGKDGPIPCHWRVGFSSDGEFNWNYTDISLDGDYTCINGVLDPDLDVATSFDLETLTLTWDGVEYQAEVD